MYSKIKKHSCNRIKFLRVDDSWFYKWYQTFLQWLKDEIVEMEQELKENNSVYLEDELWDIFWDYMCLLNSLEQEWKISWVDNVLNRSYKKFSERIWENWKHKWVWEEIKKTQKEELKLEHNKLYNNGK